VLTQTASTREMSREIPLLFWFVGLLVLGLGCGLAVFAGEQNEQHKFLAAQRLPAGTIWAAKVLFWGTTLFVVTLLAGAASIPIGDQWASVPVPRMLMGIWPLYGFCFAQFL